VHIARGVPGVGIAAVGIAVQKAGVELAVPAAGVAVTGGAAGAVVAVPPDLDDQVIAAVILEGRVEVEAPPGFLGSITNVQPAPVKYRTGSPAAVVADVTGGEGGEIGVAERYLERVEVPGQKGLGGAGPPLPPRNAARREGVPLQDQVLVPVGVPTSTPGEGMGEVAGIDADDVLRRDGRGGRADHGDAQ
jgi:hypothetical protein